MDELFCSVKYSEHKKVTKKLVEFKQKLRTRVIRICITDPYATDSPSDEEEYELFPRQRVKKFISEIRLEKLKSRPKGRKRQPKAKTAAAAKQGGAGQKKFMGVRRRPWGKWTSEIRHPVKKTRHWLGTYDTAEEAAMVYDSAAVKLHGPDALTNFFVRTEKDLPPAANGGSVSDAGYGYGAERSRVMDVNRLVQLTGPVQNIDECRGVTNVAPDYSIDYLPMDIPFLDDFFNFQPQDQMLLDGVIVGPSYSDPKKLDDFMMWVDELPIMDSHFEEDNLRDFDDISFSNLDSF